MTLELFSSRRSGWNTLAEIQRFPFGDPPVPTSAPVADEVKYTTRYMCACRCGIKVSLRDGKIRYIEGNRDHPVNRGVLWARPPASCSTTRRRGCASRCCAPARGGSGEFREIEWTKRCRSRPTGSARSAPRTRRSSRSSPDAISRRHSPAGGRSSSTLNYAAHGGFFPSTWRPAGFYTIGGAFWEFGELDWENTRYFMLFGVAEDHDSNPIKIGLGHLKKRGARWYQ